MSLWRTAPLVVGHRGGRGEGWPPENTMEAFERARAQGARAIELDARTCGGGDVVVFHDVTLERMTGGKTRRRCGEVRLAELRTIDLGHGARVPTLADALAWARDRDVAVNVELKHDVPDRVALARRALQTVRACRADVCVSSFDPSLLAMSIALAPEIPRALLVHHGQGWWAHALQEIIRPPIAFALHLERTQTEPRALARYTRRGLRRGVWTVNDGNQALDLILQGVETIITDAPGAILAAITRRN